MLNINVFIKKFGFTLAEVLITLGIIGIVAEMTIPTLMNNFQKTVYVTRLKKSYSMMNQVLLQMTSDSNCSGDLKCSKLMATGTSYQSFGDELTKYFKIAKNCGNFLTTSLNGCFPDTVAQNYDGSNSSSGYDSWAYRFVTADGMSFLVLNDNNDCAGSFSAGITNNLTQVCGAIYIDVNGLQKPNAIGRDIFYFYITNGKGALIYPSGGIDDTGYVHWVNGSGVPTGCCPTQKNGMFCSGRVIEEGWQMNY